MWLSVLVRFCLVVHRLDDRRCFESRLLTNGTVDGEISSLLLFFKRVVI